MSGFEGLVAGLTGKTEITVAEEHTAPHVGSGQVRVLATPVLTNLLEAAALAAAERFVPAGHQTVGTLLAIKHSGEIPRAFDTGIFVVDAGRGRAARKVDHSPLEK